MLRWLALCLALWPLAACHGGGTVANTDTGITGLYTQQARISDHPHHVLMGHVVVTSRQADTTRALVIHQRRDGLHRLRFSEAWENGIELPFSRVRGLGCTHGHCRDYAMGMILLSEALMAHAAQHGLRARLIGQAGAIDIHAPPALFAEALTRAARM